MPTTQYLVNNRIFTAHNSLEQELNYSSHKNYLFELSYMGCIDVVGARGSEFLQGQLSCNINDINSSSMRPGVMCNLKGRVLAILDVVEWCGLRLILPNDLIIETCASLSKTAMFSIVSLVPTTNFQVFGFYLQNSDDIVPFDAPLPKEHYDVITGNNYCCYALGNNYYIFIVAIDHTLPLKESFLIHDQLRGSLAWHALRIGLQNVEIYPESRGLFLPHNLYLHQTGHLNFKKGCYKGQEIIARMHYRATLKHKLICIEINSSIALKSGQRLLSQNDNHDIGELIDFCPINNKNNYLCIVSVPITEF